MGEFASSHARSPYQKALAVDLPREPSHHVKRAEPASLVLSPEQLNEFKKIDPALPALIVEARTLELERRFRYAMLSLLAGMVSFGSIVGGFVYLVIAVHPQAAGLLLGAGVLGLVGGFVRNRL